MTNELVIRVNNELKTRLPNIANKNVLAIINEIENPKLYIDLLLKAGQLTLFTDSSSIYKQLDKEIESLLKKPILNYASFNKAELGIDSFDVILLIKSFNRLNVDEKQKMLQNLLNILKVNGQVFLYENEWSKDKENCLGNPADLIHYFHSIVINGKEKHGFKLVFARPLYTYVEYKYEPLHLCYIFNKIKKEDNGLTFQDFLDQRQYSKNGVLSYEKIFGPGFVSTGGLDTTKEFVASLNLKNGQHILDVGCGIGGGDFYMAKNYGCSVIGVDLSVNMVSVAYERSMAMTDNKLKVSFEIGDIMEHEFEADSFDTIYSRDTILHIADKASLFSRLYNWLKSGGQLFISDYTCAPKSEWTAKYEAYVKQRQYTVLTVPEYGQLLEKAGFKDVIAEDATEKFIQCLKTELARIESLKDDCIQEFSENDYQALINGWREKIERTASGSQRWGIFRARK